jgi:hypothetical protein
MEGDAMDINLEELRKERRPLWMTDLSVESYADLLGGGGDIQFDRVEPEWGRSYGSEITEAEFNQAKSSSHYEEGSGVRGQSSQGFSGTEHKASREAGSHDKESLTDTISHTVGALGGVLKNTIQKVKEAVK